MNRYNRLSNTDLPSASVTRFGSVSAALINVNSPIIPNWSVTIPFGMFEIIPEVQIRQKNYETEEGKLGEKKNPENKSQTGCRQNKSAKNMHKVGKPNALEVPKEFPTQITQLEQSRNLLNVIMTVYRHDDNSCYVLVSVRSTCPRNEWRRGRGMVVAGVSVASVAK